MGLGDLKAVGDVEDSGDGGHLSDRVDSREKVEKEIGDKEYKLSRSCSGRGEKGQQRKGAGGLQRIEKQPPVWLL